MAALFTSRDLVGKLRKNYTITGRVKTDGLLRIEAKNLDEARILTKFQKAINRASEIAAKDLKAALDNALTSDVWKTLQGNADIYDTGELLQSGRVTVSQQGLSISYDAPYAALVHYGGYILPYGRTDVAKVYLPPRPWVEAVLNGGGPVPQFNFSKYYLTEIQKEFR